MDKETDTRQLKRKHLKDGIIKVIGVGGGGIHAVSHMYREGIGGLTFATCDTCNDTLNNSPVPVYFHLDWDSQGKDNSAECATLGVERCEPELRSMLNDGTTVRQGGRHACMPQMPCSKGFHPEDIKLTTVWHTFRIIACWSS